MFGWRVRLGNSCLRRFGDKDGAHEASLHLQVAFQHSDIGNSTDQIPQDLFAQIGMDNLTPAKHERQFDLVPIQEELTHLFDFGGEIVWVNSRAKFDFLDMDLLGFFPGLFGFPLLFILKLVEVHDAADGRFGSFCHLNQIQSCLLSHFQSLFNGHHADLRAIF